MDPNQLFKEGNPKTTNDRIIICPENKSKYIAKNPKEKLNCKIRIDNALIKSNNVSKCDFGLWVEEGNRMILIELKGSDVEWGLNQLLSTHNLFQSRYREEDFTYSFRIVPTRVTTPNLQERVKQLKKQGYDLKIQTRVLEETI